MGEVRREGIWERGVCMYGEERGMGREGRREGRGEDWREGRAEEGVCLRHTILQQLILVLSSGPHVTHTITDTNNHNFIT
jgi:hypothetical protein